MVANWSRILASLTCVSFESFGRTLSDSHVPFSAGAADQLNGRCREKQHALCAPRQHADVSRQLMAKHSGDGCTVHVHLIISSHGRIVKVSHS